MRERGLRSVRARQRRIGLTKAEQRAYVAPIQMQQDFRASRLNPKWITDTTYIPTRAGWLYLVSVMDLFSLQVVGWAMGEQHDADLATSALDMAIYQNEHDVGSPLRQQVEWRQHFRRAGRAGLRHSPAPTGCHRA